MKCEGLLTYLSDYIDRELTEDFTAAAQDHLATCENCQVVLNTTQKTIALHKQQDVTIIPAERRERLFSQLQDAFQARTSESE